MDVLLRIASVVLQYGILCFLFVFLARITRCIWKDWHAAEQAMAKGGMPKHEAVLTVTAASENGLLGKRFAFPEEISIGRGAENDIVIPEAYVSQHHAVISLQNNLFVLEDLGSRNHTYLNGEALNQRAYLQSGDQIRIGMVTFTFER